MFLVSVKSETLGHVPKGNALYGEVTGRQNILLFYSDLPRRQNNLNKTLAWGIDNYWLKRYIGSA